MGIDQINEYEGQAQSLSDKSREQLDEALLKICSLGVPLSILFIDREGFSKAEHQWLFGLFLISWLITVASQVASFKVAEHKWFYYDFSDYDPSQGIKILPIEILNWISLIGFGIGLVSIIVYAVANRQLF